MTGPIPPIEAIFISTLSLRLTAPVPVAVILPELPVTIETTAGESDPVSSIVSVVMFPIALIMGEKAFMHERFRAFWF